MPAATRPATRPSAARTMRAGAVLAALAVCVGAAAAAPRAVSAADVARDVAAALVVGASAEPLAAPSEEPRGGPLLLPRRGERGRYEGKPEPSLAPVVPDPMVGPRVDSEDVGAGEDSRRYGGALLYRGKKKKSVERLVCNRGRVSAADAVRCCEERGVGCVVKGDLCRTRGEGAPYVPCELGSECVLIDFGLVDRENEGVCADVVHEVQPPPKPCSIDFCSRYGDTAVCVLAEKRVAQCGAWASRDDGGRRPDCRLACTDECVMDDGPGPMDNEGHMYCSKCVLQRRSCRSNFTIYGPVYEISRA